MRPLPADLRMLAHQGDKAYADTYELVHRREAECSNAIWQADHTLLDILVTRGELSKLTEEDRRRTMERFRLLRAPLIPGSATGRVR